MAIFPSDFQLWTRPFTFAVLKSKYCKPKSANPRIKASSNLLHTVGRNESCPPKIKTASKVSMKSAEMLRIFWMATNEVDCFVSRPSSRFKETTLATSPPTFSPGLAASVSVPKALTTKREENLPGIYSTEQRRYHCKFSSNWVTICMNSSPMNKERGNFCT